MSQGFTQDLPIPLPVVKGGTGSKTALDARTSLGLGTTDAASFGTVTGSWVATTLNTWNNVGDKVVTPATMRSHGGVCKFYVNFNGTSGAVNGSYFVSSVTDNGTGNFTVNFTFSFGDTIYAVWGCSTDGYHVTQDGSGLGVSSVQMTIRNGLANVDSTRVYVAAVGYMV